MHVFFRRVFCARVFSENFNHFLSSCNWKNSNIIIEYYVKLDKI